MFRKVAKRKIKFPDRGEHREAAGATAKALNSLDADASPQKIGSKETAMPTRRFDRIALAQLL